MGASVNSKGSADTDPSTPPVTGVQFAKQLQHAAAMVRDWMGNGCLEASTPRGQIALLVTFAEEVSSSCAQLPQGHAASGSSIAPGRKGASD